MNNQNNQDYKPDSVIQSIINKFISRGKLGLEKYGTTLDRNDLSLLDWINHAQEEHLDAILYLEKIRQEIQKNNNLSTLIKENSFCYTPFNFTLIFVLHIGQSISVSTHLFLSPSLSSGLSTFILETTQLYIHLL